MSQPRVYIVVPTYNRKETALRLLEQLKRMNVLSWAHVIAADSDSPDGTPDEVERHYPEVTVLRNACNRWWTGLICQGTRHALRKGADYVIWLNEDCRPREGSLELLLQTSQEQSAVCGGFFYATDTNRTHYAGAHKTAMGVKAITSIDEPYVPCDSLDGALICTPRKILETVGLPDERHMPHYLSDIDYTLRVSRAGYPVLLVRDVKGETDPNLSEQYKDWLRDPDVSMRRVWASLLSPRSRSYLPAQIVFKTRHWGLTGLLRSILFVPKLACITLARPIATRC